MKVVIAGSQKWPDAVAIRAFVHRLPVPSVVIVGGAPGADTIAEEEAGPRGHEVIVMRADWRVKDDTPPGRIRYRKDGTPYDAAAGMLRTNAMLDEDPALVAVFWLGRSPGSRHTIRESMRRGIPLEVHWRPG